MQDRFSSPPVVQTNTSLFEDLKKLASLYKQEGEQNFWLFQTFLQKFLQENVSPPPGRQIPPPPGGGGDAPPPVQTKTEKRNDSS